jgi:dipeptidase
MEGGLPNIGPNPTNTYDPETMWWQHEQIHRAILEDYQTRIRIVTPDIEHYEEKWISKVIDVRSRRNSQPIDQFKEELAKLSEEAFAEAREIERNWISALEKVPIRKRSGGFYYRRLWRKENSKAGLKL